VTHKPMAAGLELLPKTYEDMKPTLGPPLPGDLGEAYLVKDREVSAPTTVAEVLEPRPRRRTTYSAPTQASYQPPVPVYTPPVQQPKTQSLFFDVGRKANAAFRI